MIRVLCLVFRDTERRKGRERTAPDAAGLVEGSQHGLQGPACPAVRQPVARAGAECGERARRGGYCACQKPEQRPRKDACRRGRRRTRSPAAARPPTVREPAAVRKGFRERWLCQLLSGRTQPIAGKAPRPARTRTAPAHRDVVQHKKDVVLLHRPSAVQRVTTGSAARAAIQ